MTYIIQNRQYLQHHGILGMKWGIRRFQPYSVRPRGSGKSGKEVGEAKKLSSKVKEFARGDQYEKKEIARLRTGLEMVGKSAIISSLSSLSGATLLAATGNPYSALIGAQAIAAVLSASSIGKINIYFKR